MNFELMLKRIDDIVMTRQRGEEDETCRVRRQDLRELLSRFRQLDAEIRAHAAEPSSSGLSRGSAEASAHATAAAAWSDPISAPKDGTILHLLVRPGQQPLDPFTSFHDSREPYETIGFNNLKNTLEDVWQFAGWDWSHDCITEGDGDVIGWRPFAIKASPAAPSADPRHEAEDDAAAALAARLLSLEKENKDLRHELACAKGRAKNATSNCDYWKSQYETATAATKRQPDYVFNPEDWESTFDWADRDLVHGHGEALKGTMPMAVDTLFLGPRKWVVNVPISFDEDGDIDESEVRWFDSEDEAIAAAAVAAPEAKP